MAESWRLQWGAIWAGAAIAVALAWTGNLLGGLITLIQPGASSVWGWLGGIIQLLFWAAGGFIGAYVATRTGLRRTRTSGMVHGLVVWGLLGVWSALLFALLGGTVSLAGGATAGAVRLTLGFNAVAMGVSFLAVLMGGIAGHNAALETVGPTRTAEREEEETPTLRRPEDREPPYRPPTGPGAPPSVH